MHLKTKISLWESPSMEERQTITNGFKELYNHKNIQQENPTSLDNNLIIILESIIYDNNSYTTPATPIPKKQIKRHQRI